MKFKRRQGETVKQIEERSNIQIDEYRKQVAEAYRLRDLAISQTEMINPRTKALYKDEASSLFLTMAIIEKFLRDGHVDEAKQMAQQQLLFLGFNEVELYTDKLLEDGAYNEQK